MSDNATVWSLPLYGSWQALTSVEGVQCDSDLYGSSGATFTVKRQTRGAGSFPELAPETPIDIEVAGSVVWSGFIDSAALSDDAVVVSCKGWQHHLDDSLFDRSYIKSRLSEWLDAKGAAGANLNVVSQVTRVQQNIGALVLGSAYGDVFPAATRGGVILDMGSSSFANYVTLSWSGHSANTNTQTLILCYGTSVANVTAAASSYNIVVLGPGQPQSGTITSAPAANTYRYVGVFVADNTATVQTWGADVWIRIIGISVYAETSYWPYIKASTIVADAISRATRLQQTSSMVQASSFDIVDFATGGRQTPRDVMTAAGAYEDYQLSVDVQRRVVFRPRPTTPRYQATSLVSFDDAGYSSDDLVNQVIVEGSDPGGAPISQVVNASSLAGYRATVPDKWGFTKARTVSVSNAITAAAAAQIGSVYLGSRVALPFRGSATFPVGGARQGPMPVHPSSLLLATGELVRFPARIDPDTGGISRNGRVVSVTYDHDARAAAVAFDSSRANFEAYLERVGALVAQRTGTS